MLERVRDAVAREALRQERDRVEAELARGDLVLVVFGSGSAGKTSLIRALLQQVVGEVGAAMGSTTTCHTYRLRLKGLQRGLQLVDTPGILESGRDGQEREREARAQAARADLLVLVVDGDLRAAEFQVFEALASLGKRLVLVLNKCDLRGEEEERRLLALLRQRCCRQDRHRGCDPRRRGAPVDPQAWRSTASACSGSGGPAAPSLGGAPPGRRRADRRQHPAAEPAPQ